MKLLRTPIALAGIALASIVPAGAAIVLDASTFWTDATDSGTKSFVFNASASDKLVVLVTIEHHFGPGNLTGNVIGLTYNSQALTRIVEEPTGGLSTGGTSEIWYLDNPNLFVGTNEVTINNNGNNYVVTALGLSGTAAGFGNSVAVDGAYSGNLTATAGSYVVAMVGLGGNGNTGQSADVNPNAPLTVISRNTRASNWVGHATAGALVTSSGAATYSFTDGTPGTDISFVAVEFTALAVAAPIPEPSSLILIGLGGLALLRRRR